MQHMSFYLIYSFKKDIKRAKDSMYCVQKQIYLVHPFLQRKRKKITSSILPYALLVWYGSVCGCHTKYAAYEWVVIIPAVIDNYLYWVSSLSIIFH